jgi:hypothetical protein
MYAKAHVLQETSWREEYVIISFYTQSKYITLLFNTITIRNIAFTKFLIFININIYFYALSVPCDKASEMTA